MRMENKHLETFLALLRLAEAVKNRGGAVASIKVVASALDVLGHLTSGKRSLVHIDVPLTVLTHHRKKTKTETEEV